MKVVRGLVAGALALLVALQVVRSAAVAALAETKPAAAVRIWGDHPVAELSAAMTAIATAARQGLPVSPAIFRAVDDAASKAPLAAEPYLVRGVQAQIEGNSELATRAFRAAEWRDPRSLPAHYFLADHFLRAGDVSDGLREFGAVARLAPNGLVSVSPYVASFARDPDKWPQLKALFRSDPDLAETTLDALAHDASNAPAILALADSAHRNARSPWLPVLLGSLVSAGQYQRAQAIWARISRVRTGSGQLLFDANFSDATAPAPFNWTLTSSTVGLAERQAGARLHVIYYGQEDGPLASQLLVLPAGKYALAMRVTGGGTLGALRWTLTCANAQAPFATVPLDALARGAWKFDVPAGCGAQRLDLMGISSDIAQQVDVTLAGLSLVPAAAHG